MAASDEERAETPKEPEKTLSAEEQKLKKEKEGQSLFRLCPKKRCLISIFHCLNTPPWTMLTCFSCAVLYLRHKLQKGFLSRDQAPKEEEMAAMSNYIQKLEQYNDLEVSIIRQTKINKVLKAIIKLNTIPKEEEYHFRQRSVDILGKWKHLLESDLPKEEASGSKDAEEEPKANGVQKNANGKKDSETPASEEKEKKEDTKEDEAAKADDGTKETDEDVSMPDAGDVEPKEQAPQLAEDEKDQPEAESEESKEKEDSKETEETAEEATKEASKDEPKEVSMEEESKDESKENESKEVSVEEPKEASKDEPKEVSTEESKEAEKPAEEATKEATAAGEDVEMEGAA